MNIKLHTSIAKIKLVRNLFDTHKNWITCQGLTYN